MMGFAAQGDDGDALLAQRRLWAVLGAGGGWQEQRGQAEQEAAADHGHRSSNAVTAS